MSASVCSLVSFDSQSSSASSIHDAIQHLETVKLDLMLIHDSQKQIESLRELKASLEEEVEDLKSVKYELEDSISTMRKQQQKTAEKPKAIKKQRKSTSVKKWRRMVRTNRLQSILLC